PPRPPLLPYTTLFRSEPIAVDVALLAAAQLLDQPPAVPDQLLGVRGVSGQVVQLPGIGLEVEELLVAVTREPHVLVALRADPLHRVPAQGADQVLAVQMLAHRLPRRQRRAQAPAVDALGDLHPGR